jgi:hypothetical protein
MPEYRSGFATAVAAAIVAGIAAGASAEVVQLTCSSPLLPMQQYYLLDTARMTSKQLSGNAFVEGTLTASESVYQINLPRHHEGAPMQVVVNRFTGKGYAEWGSEPLGVRSAKNARSTVTCTKTEREPKL